MAKKKTKTEVETTPPLPQDEPINKTAKQSFGDMLKSINAARKERVRKIREKNGKG